MYSNDTYFLIIPMSTEQFRGNGEKFNNATIDTIQYICIASFLQDVVTQQTNSQGACNSRNALCYLVSCDT